MHFGELSPSVCFSINPCISEKLDSDAASHVRVYRWMNGQREKPMFQAMTNKLIFVLWQMHFYYI